MLALFYLLNSQILPISSKQNTFRLKHGLQHFRSQPSEFTMFLRNVCPPLICESNGYTVLGQNQIDHCPLRTRSQGS